LKELAGRLGCPYEGDGETEIAAVAAPENAGAGDLIFVATDKFLPYLKTTRAAAAVLAPGMDRGRLPALRSPQPQMTFVRAADILQPPVLPAPGVHPAAVVDPSARLGADVSIGPLCVVGAGAEIGDGTVLFPHVTIYPEVRIGPACVLHSGVSLRRGVKLGARVILHNGVVVGADGFGYLRTADGSQLKIPQLGSVLIEDDVEVGANSTIDRATLGMTIVRRGAKIDNLVIVAHNVEIGENAILVAQVGVAGSSKVGRGAILSGQAGVPDHVTIGDGAIVAAKTGVTGNVPAGAIVSGSPHLDIMVWRKFWAAAPRLYDLVKEIRRLRDRVEALEKKS
ncbi:MAG: UDP-3-O-(3-hydroxymyristoyl)glucosamine N-acyltransferase, partial [Acidobacteriota bacterium]|nr:UDP-3-O-(3-hydroxymyristoyl)glucosamine N-acyltransferase [Acidobacteriota bacterium]